MFPSYRVIGEFIASAKLFLVLIAFPCPVAGHSQDLAAQLKEQGDSYVLVVPEGMDWLPTTKDDATIFKEMRNLGCQLKQVTHPFW